MLRQSKQRDLYKFVLCEGLAALSNGFDSAQVPPRPTLMVGAAAALLLAACC
jgi:hypothetical protein